MSDSQTFSGREPSAATLALNLMFSKLIDALIANGVLTNDQSHWRHRFGDPRNRRQLYSKVRAGRARYHEKISWNVSHIIEPMDLAMSADLQGCLLAGKQKPRRCERRSLRGGARL